MMSEKRFIVGDDGIFRKGEKLYNDDEIAQIINEQQATISKLTFEKGHLEAKLKNREKRITELKYVIRFQEKEIDSYDAIDERQNRIR